MIPASAAPSWVEAGSAPSRKGYRSAASPNATAARAAASSPRLQGAVTAATAQAPTRRRTRRAADPPTSRAGSRDSKRARSEFTEASMAASGSRGDDAPTQHLGSPVEDCRLPGRDAGDGLAELEEAVLVAGRHRPGAVAQPGRALDRR